MAVHGVIGTAMKSCILRHPMHPDQRPLRLTKPKKISLFWFEVVLAASGASDPDVPMDATFHEQTSVVSRVYRWGKIFQGCR